LTSGALPDGREKAANNLLISDRTEGPGRWLASFAWWKVRARAGPWRAHVTEVVRPAPKLQQFALCDENNGHVYFSIRDVLSKFQSQLMRFVVEFRRRILPLLLVPADGKKIRKSRAVCRVK
jgi:hypothetical protein